MAQLPESQRQPLPGAPELADDPAEAGIEQGRVGYGRLGRFSPLILGLLLLLALLVIWILQRDGETQPAGPSPAGAAGEMAPDVSLTLLDGRTLTLEDLRGNVVVLNFWASWCAPCRQEMPELQAYWEDVQASGERTEIVGVGIRTDHDEDARAVVVEGGYTYPIGRDTNTDNPGVGPVEAAFGVPAAYPATVIVRPDGRIDRLQLGPVNRETLRLMVDEARQASG